ncbi:MAG: hypothetical protein GXO24_03490 [Chlorobi bacterium]|nr:hypothetical protein [Chlorobiota bacterium]
MKILERILIFIFIFVILSNIFSGYINAYTEAVIPVYHFETCNGQFSFDTYPTKGTDIKKMEQAFRRFLKQHPEYDGYKLYRTFKRDPWKFWNWYSYLTRKRYRYPYKARICKE